MAQIDEQDDGGEVDEMGGVDRRRGRGQLAATARPNGGGMSVKLWDGRGRLDGDREVREGASATLTVL